jgi:dephospho-CoA kinase
MKKRIGLIGGSGCGKSTVASLLCKYGLDHIDCDQIARQVVEPGRPCLAELVEYFGSGIINGNGSLNRAQLAKLAFSNSVQTQALNRITHKYILAQTDEAFEKAKSQLGVVIDAAALAESGYLDKCDCVIAVVSLRHKRLCRIMKRDNIGLLAAWRRLRAQKPDAFYRSYADYVIVNDSDFSKLEKQTKQIFDQIFMNQLKQED